MNFPRSLARKTATFLALSTSLAFGTSSFENFPTGKFQGGTDESGQWKANPEQVEIFNKGKESGKSLRLLGGNDQHVEVGMLQPVSRETAFSFFVERYTAQGDCEVRVSAQVEGNWVEVVRDKNAAVGNFSHEIKGTIPAGTTAIRLSSTSTGGVLIENFHLTEQGPVTIRGVQVEYPTVPVLRGLSVNPLASIRFLVAGSEQAPTFDGLQIQLDGTTRREDIESIDLIESDRLPSHNRKINIVASQKKPASSTISFRLKEAISASKTYWVSVVLKNTASNQSRVKVAISHLSVAGKSVVFESTNKPNTHLVGYALRKPGDDGSKAFRIPGLVRTKRGTLLAVYDIRYRHGGDLPADIDVGCSRSTDGGQTWSEMAVAMDMGNDPKFSYDGIGDPSILVDEKTGRIWIAAVWNHGNRGWNTSGPGLEPEETGQFILVSSDDDGKSWSKPINITKSLKNPEWRLFFQGPGAGITMKNGTLVFPAQFRDAKGMPFSTVITSKDQGKTWTCGTGVKDNTTESQVAELSDGSLMLNCRDNRGGSRTIAVSRDLGQSWSLHPTDRKALIEPVCMASFLRVDAKTHGTLFLFSNPHSTKSRNNMSLQISRDNAATWSPAYLYDQRDCYGYSCLAPVDENHIGILYEGEGDLFFLKVPYAEFLK